MRNTIRHQTTAVALLLSFFLWACGSESEPECTPPPPKVVEETPFRLPRNDSVKDGDHCQVCVKSQGGFISCQRVWQENKDETRDQLKVRATEKSCKDAGYPDTCPKEAILSMLCKGDPVPDGGRTATAKIQQIMMKDRPAPATTSPSAPQGGPQGSPAPTGAVPIE